MLRRAVSLRSTPAFISGNTVNPLLKGTSYAVRGPIVDLANRLETQLASGTRKFPFSKLIYCNIGNPQQLGQTPLTFPREVLALVSAPHLLKHPKVETLFSAEAVARAAVLVKELGGTGAYTHSLGLPHIRKNVAKFIEARDNASSGRQLGAVPFDSVWLSAGASPAIQSALQLHAGGGLGDGVMIPIPQYPLYSASISLLGASAVPYFLDEAAGWAVDRAALEASYQKAVEGKVTPRVMVVLNPGNPTGQVLDPSTMRTILQFCHDKKLSLFADEVYQSNVYAEGKKYHSFRSVALQMEGPVRTELPIFSFHTVSKGLFGECGRRGGYMQLMNVPAAVVDQFTKLPSINLCPPIGGQVMVDLMVQGPPAGTPAATLFDQETTAIFSSLKRRAVSLVKELNQIEGFQCNEVEGAMYAFPTIRLPAKFIEEAAKLTRTHDAYGEPLSDDHALRKAVEPDFLWCWKLVEQQGIVTIPGSGFRQRDGTFHFRTTILPPEAEMSAVTKQLGDFQRWVWSEFK